MHKHILLVDKNGIGDSGNDNTLILIPSRTISIMRGDPNEVTAYLLSANQRLPTKGYYNQS